MGQMWEQVISKLTALLGNTSKVGTCGVPFTHVERMRQACDQLHEAGYPRWGREPMYSGITGERLDGDVFIGMVYYQRLRHMVQIHPLLPAQDKGWQRQVPRTRPRSRQSARQATYRRACTTWWPAHRRDGTRPGARLAKRRAPVDRLSHCARRNGPDAGTVAVEERRLPDGGVPIVWSRHVSQREHLCGLSDGRRCHAPGGALAEGALKKKLTYECSLGATVSKSC